MPLPDTSVCPICGERNLCAMELEKATGVQQQACWCTHVDFSRELLQAIPEELRGVSCLCARCAGGS